MGDGDPYQYYPILLCMIDDRYHHYLSHHDFELRRIGGHGKISTI